MTVCMLLLTAIALASAAYVLRPVIVPFILALLFTYCLAPIIDFQMRLLRVPRIVAIGLTAVLGVVLLLGLVAIVSMAVNHMMDNAEDYQKQMTALFDRFDDWPLLEKWGLKEEGATLETQVLDRLSASFGSLMSMLASSLLGVLSNALMVLIFMIFLLFGQGRTGGKAGELLHEIERSIKGYAAGMVLLSGIMGVAIGLILMLLGLPAAYAWIFGFLAAILNFIPNIGPVVATLLPAPVVFLDPNFPLWAAICAIAIPGAIQFIVGNVVQPKVFGSSLDLHPVVVLMTLIFFGMIWGIVGMFLATPITAVLKIILEKAEYTRPFAQLLAGRLDGVMAMAQIDEE